jgi:hypothetical protein
LAIVGAHFVERFADEACAHPCLQQIELHESRHRPARGGVCLQVRIDRLQLRRVECAIEKSGGMSVSTARGPGRQVVARDG